MITYFSQARVTESHPCQVSWLGYDNKPISVKDVTATLFKYEGVIRTTIIEPVAMQQTDQSHRYITKFVIPNDASGQVLFVQYKALLVADESEIFAEQIIAVAHPVEPSQPANNIITVV